MDEKLPPPSPEEQEQRLVEDRASRRTFLMNIGILLNAAVGLAIATPVVGYFLGPVLKRREYLAWTSLGKANQFTPGETRLINFTNPFHNSWDGATAQVPCYVRCTEPGKFVVFAINCAHLNCPVRWFSESQLFMCPCHGGVYYADGSRASGPPERGLFTYDVKVENGQLYINAGQMPTLQNRAGKGDCPGAKPDAQPAIVASIDPVRPGPRTNQASPRNEFLSE